MSKLETMCHVTVASQAVDRLRYAIALEGGINTYLNDMIRYIMIFEFVQYL